MSTIFFQLFRVRVVISRRTFYKKSFFRWGTKKMLYIQNRLIIPLIYFLIVWLGREGVNWGLMYLYILLLPLVYFQLKFSYIFTSPIFLSMKYKSSFLKLYATIEQMYTIISSVWHRRDPSIILLLSFIIQWSRIPKIPLYICSELSLT